MKTKLKFFDNRSAAQSFLVLFVGFLIILISGIYIFNVFLDINRPRVSRQRLMHEVVRTVRLAKALPVDRLPRQIKTLQAPGLYVKLEKKPLTDAKIIRLVDPKQLRLAVKRNFSGFKISVPLSDGRWLNVERRIVQHPWFSIGFLATSLVLLLAIVLLCYLVVKHLSIPLSEFVSATKRFGMDVHAPPLAMAGPEEIQEAVRSFNEMQSRIRRLLQDRTQMLAAVSHDLRTPITRLQLRAEYLKDTVQYEKAIADLKEMESMISSILSFSRDYAHTETMERFDLNVLLETLCDDMVDMGREVVLTDKTERIAYFGRMSSLKRAFINFIDNAVKYGKRADVTLSRTQSEIQIKITDDGPGIPEDRLEKVFDPFYRVDPARSPQISGTGLGTTVAREIIRTHGGDVTLMNRKPNGLTVLITLPFTELK